MGLDTLFAACWAHHRASEQAVYLRPEVECYFILNQARPSSYTALHAHRPRPMDHCLQEASINTASFDSDPVVANSTGTSCQAFSASDSDVVCPDATHLARLTTTDDDVHHQLIQMSCMGVQYCG